MALELKRGAFRFKAAGVAADGTFEGYGSVFGVVDSYGDIMLPGAFAASLAEHAAAGTRPKGLWQHDPLHPILSWDQMLEDEHGLACKGRLILEVEKARETYALMKAGELDGLSIGFDIREAEDVTADQVFDLLGLDVGDASPGETGAYRLLKSVGLWEVSVVTYPACAPATIETVKAQPSATPDLTPLLAALDRRGRVLRRLTAKA